MPQTLSVHAGWETAAHIGGGAQDARVQRVRAETHDWQWNCGRIPKALGTAFDSELLMRLTAEHIPVFAG